MVRFQRGGRPPTTAVVMPGTPWADSRTITETTRFAVSDAGYQYRGDLRDTALPEVLFTIHRHRVPGTIEVRHGEVSKRLFVHDGLVIHASSSEPGDSLGAYLRGVGRVNDEEFQRTDAIKAATGQRHGTILVEEQILAPGELYQAIQAHLESILYSVFSWNEGEVTFKIGEFDAPGMVRISLPLRRVVLEGIKRAADPKPLVTRLGGRETVFQPTFSTEDLIEIALDRDEYQLLRAIDGRRSLYDLCTAGPLGAADAARRLYAFHVLHLVRKRPESPGVVKIRYRPGRS